MRDDQHLRGLGEFSQAGTQLHSGLATHAGVDLIEDERHRRHGSAGHDMLFSGHQFEREHQTAQLAAGCAFAHRQLRGAGERGEEEFDVVRSGSVQLFAFGHANLKFRSAHGQRVKFGGDFGSKLLGRGPAPFAYSLRGFFRRVKQLRPFGFQLFDLFRGGVQILQIVYGLVSPCDHVGQFRPPSAGQLVQLVDAPVDGVQILHTRFVVHFSRQAEHHVGQVGADGVKPVGKLGEHAFHMDGAQRLRGTVDQIGRAGRFDIVRHLRGVQRAQRSRHAFGDLGRVFDAVAARTQFVHLPRLRVDTVDAFD